MRYRKVNPELLLLKKEMERYFASIQDDLLREACQYCLDSNGKYIRPQLFFLALQTNHLEYKNYISFALAIEMIHTYSLIHDDLPCMDDDDFRRGKPSLHKQYNEGIAVLVGDTLLSDAFFVLSQHSNPLETILALQCLSACIGSNGMIYGQILDLRHQTSNLSLNERFHIDCLKTGKLFEYCLVLPAKLANQSEKEIQLYEKLDHLLGMIYQIKDDLQDEQNIEMDLQEILFHYQNQVQNILQELNLDEKNELVVFIQNYF